MKPADIARFWAKVDTTGTCWLWTASRLPRGYGQWHLPTYLGYRSVLAHRLAYELSVGPIPDGLQIDHLCNTPSCVNPSHLEPVTQAENLRRGRERRTHCSNGHEWTEANSYINPSTGFRECRGCGRERAYRRYQARKAVAA